MKKFIKKRIGLALAATIGQFLLGNITAQAVQIPTANQVSELYVFGDSLVDDGNLYELTGGQFPPDVLGYYQGRFSNGRVWVENLPYELKANGYGKVTLEYDSNNNYAIAGSGTDYNYALETELGLDDQVNNFLANQSSASTLALARTVSTPTVDPDALYLIAIGANDYLTEIAQGDFSFAIESVVGNITDSITQLADSGAKNFAVTGLANFAVTPLFAGISNEEKMLLGQLASQHNSLLRSALLALEEQRGLDITFVDLNSILAENTQNFTNITEACLDEETSSTCSHPNDYLFWDDEHLTGRAHNLLAKEAVESYRQRNGQGASIPEPQTIFGLLAVAVFSQLLKRN